MFYSLNPTSAPEHTRATSPGVMVADTKLANGNAPPVKRSMLQDASNYAYKAFSAGVQGLQPAGEAALGSIRDCIAWGRAGGTWRLILLGSAAAVLACVACAVCALISVTVTVGCSLLFFTALLGLGALVSFLVALCAVASLVFLGTVLAAAAVIGAVASAAVCCVLLASVWVLGAWAVFALFQSAWRTVTSLLAPGTRVKKIDYESASTFSQGDSWEGKGEKPVLVNL